MCEYEPKKHYSRAQTHFNELCCPGLFSWTNLVISCLIFPIFTQTLVDGNREKITGRGFLFLSCSVISAILMHECSWDAKQMVYFYLLWCTWICTVDGGSESTAYGNVETKNKFSSPMLNFYAWWKDISSCASICMLLHVLHHVALSCFFCSAMLLWVLSSFKW